MKWFKRWKAAYIELFKETPPEEKIDRIGVSKFERLINDKEVPLIDVRTRKEYTSGHIPGALHIDMRSESFISTAIGCYPHSEHFAVYCSSGHRSLKAARLLAENGYHVSHLRGGLRAWLKAGKKVEESTENRW